MPLSKKYWALFDKPLTRNLVIKARLGKPSAYREAGRNTSESTPQSEGPQDWYNGEVVEKLESSGNLLQSFKKSEVFSLDLSWETLLQTADTQLCLEEILNSYTLADLEDSPYEFQTEELTFLSNCVVLWLYMWAKNLFVPTYPFNNRYYQLVVAMKWLYDEQLGSPTEIVLTQYLKNASATKEPHGYESTKYIQLTLKNDFKDNFLLFQDKNPYLFGTDLTIGSHTFGVRGLVFKKSNLLKIIRLIINNYNSSFWSGLSQEIRFLFLKAIVLKTRELGNYSLINQLFEAINLVDGEVLTFLFGHGPTAYKLVLSKTKVESKLTLSSQLALTVDNQIGPVGPLKETNLTAFPGRSPSFLFCLLGFGVCAQLVSIIFLNLPTAKRVQLAFLLSNPVQLFQQDSLNF